jgi:hypothetical protein
MEWQSCWTVITSAAVELSRLALAIVTWHRVLLCVYSRRSAGTGRPNALSGRITEKLDFIIIVIVIAGPVVKSRNARMEMALRAALNHYVRENMYIRVNAPRSILGP